MKRKSKLWVPILAGTVIGVGLLAAVWLSPFHVSAQTQSNISPVSNQHWAWNDSIGWLDFYYYNNTSNSVVVTSTQLTGSASSSLGPVSLDCSTSPGGNICSSGNGNYVVTNDGSGNLGGWAWNDAVGWIAFYWGNSTANPASSTTNGACLSYGSYCGVWYDSSGNFRGYAWSDTVGWISFNCIDIGTSECLRANSYEVLVNLFSGPLAGTLDSATFDTSSTGAQLNSVMWHGTLNGLAAGSVAFQFASSTTSTGPWGNSAFTGPFGTSATSDVYYGSGNPDTPIPIINYPGYSGARYFRYRLILQTNSARSVSPQVTGVSIDWSP